MTVRETGMSAVSAAHTAAADRSPSNMDAEPRWPVGASLTLSFPRAEVRFDSAVSGLKKQMIKERKKRFRVM